jgi:hypothetical protein
MGQAHPDLADLGDRVQHLVGDEVEAARSRPQPDLALHPHASES